MPKFKDACGCYNKHDARELGLAAAVVWNDIIDRAEQFDAQKTWYDQGMASERLGIPQQTISRCLKILEEAGRIKVEGGYRPKSSVRTTWITIADEYLDDNLITQNGYPKVTQNGYPILKETKERNISSMDEKSEVRMKPSVLFTKMRTFFPRSRNDNRKKQIEAVERLQSEFDLSDETILDGARALAKKGAWNIDGSEIPITLSALLLADDLGKTAKKLMVFAEAEEKRKTFGGPTNVD